MIANGVPFDFPEDLAIGRKKGGRNCGRALAERAAF
jgi:hypothetical protein